jgi:hypothetical protein
MDHWISQNAASITVIFVLAALCTIAEVLWKPVRSIISFCWSMINRRRKTASAAQSLDLRFVLMPWRSTLSVIHREDEQPNADIRTHWKVTNLSPSGMPPARLLTARLVKPRLRNARLAGAPTESANAIVISVDGERIPLGQTREVDIHFYVVLPPGRLNKPIRLKIIVVDQLSNEHKLPPITLQPIIIETTQRRPGAS